MWHMEMEFIAEDVGESWKNMLKNLNIFLKLLFIQKLKYYLGFTQGPLWSKGERGIYKSTDGGKSLTQNLEIMNGLVHRSCN